MATRSAYNEFLRVLADPDGVSRRVQHAPTLATYRRRWARYANNIFEDRTYWSSFLSRHGLYRHTRSIFNPARNIGDFYSSIIYPGVLSTDAERLPNGAQLAIPLAEDTSDELRNAIGQLWQWSNWQEGKDLYPLYGSVLGDVAVEIVDEVERGKVIFDILWPGWITDLELDGTGNVKDVTVEYDAEDENGKSYTYRKEMDTERIAEYRDNELYVYVDGVEAERANPYGFVPMVWCRHQNIGSIHGAPALRNEVAIDELNSLASHAYDRSHAVMSSPILVAGANAASLQTVANNATKAPSATESTPYNDSARESIRILIGSENAAVHSIELPEGEVAKRIEELWANIEHQHPELTMYDKLREMSQVTGPGAEVLVGDTSSLVTRARSAYDTQTIKKHQMAIAIAGWRANTGAWGGRGRSLTRQQQAFKPFDLESYQEGALDFEILPRNLFPPQQEDDMGNTRKDIEAARRLLESER